MSSIEKWIELIVLLYSYETSGLEILISCDKEKGIKLYII